MQKGFDNEKYVRLQSEKILERIEMFGDKLYLEFGGKLFDDLHAARVLPGFEPDTKIKMLSKLKDKAEIIFCINAGDIERNKVRADYGITYDMDVMRLIDNITSVGLTVGSVVITQFKNQPAASVFKNKLERRGVKTYIHTCTQGYPNDVDTIVSDKGYGANPYIETTKPLVVVTAPGPGSGKLATCLSQLYHEWSRGVRAGYAKFETFPVWNLPLKHPVNVAYEAATADLKDVNMLDPFHMEAYGKATVNYNRDIECFPVVKAILQRITGTGGPYKSPTDMGVNMVGFCITDDELVRQSAKQEIIRRRFQSWCDYKKGSCDKDTAMRVELIMNELELAVDMRACVRPALLKSEQCGVPAAAIEMEDGTVLCGKSSPLLSCTAAVLLNALKYASHIPDDILLLSPAVLEPIIQLKKDALGQNRGELSLEEVLIALSICAATNSMAALALGRLPKLRGLQAHCSHMIYAQDLETFRRLGIMATSEAEYPSENLYFS